ncbi:MAG: phage tail protein, partial [Candidatus Bathyarchaeota archaeon]|nr:phage tail protein [Candidatus Bathyarchaeota archaeon]
GNNNIRMIKSRSGHKIVLNDTEGEEKLGIKTESGHSIVLDDTLGGEKIEIKDNKGNSIAIDSVQHSISIRSNMKISIEAQMIDIKAGATLNLQGGLVKIN